jgi:hypothetical protein
MSEHPFQDFDQLQGFDSNNSRLDPFLDENEVSDLEWLGWLHSIPAGSGSAPASALISTAAATSADTIKLPSSALSGHATSFELSPMPGHTPVENSEAQSSSFTDHGLAVAHLASLSSRDWLMMSHGSYQHTAETYLHVPDSKFNNTLHRSPVGETPRVPLPTSQQTEADPTALNIAELSDIDEENKSAAEVDSLPMNIMYRCQAQCGDSEW